MLGRKVGLFCFAYFVNEMKMMDDTAFPRKENLTLVECLCIIIYSGTYFLIIFEQPYQIMIKLKAVAKRRVALRHEI